MFRNGRACATAVVRFREMNSGFRELPGVITHERNGQDGEATGCPATREALETFNESFSKTFSKRVSAALCL